MLNRRIIGLAIGLSLALAACSSLFSGNELPETAGGGDMPAAEVQDAPEAPAGGEGAGQAQPSPTAVGVENATEPAADTPAPTDAPAAEEPKAEECPYQASLHATYPGSVTLASGGVQLVEFFAFW